uniref:Uncharacterized protein n=1 Tax=Trichogramma kaykai TaxID=54128 RepID=A0ABD2WRU1_9HYME
MDMYLCELHIRDTERECDVVAVAVVAVIEVPFIRLMKIPCISSLQLNTVPIPCTPLVHNKPALLPLIVTRERNAFSKDVYRLLYIIKKNTRQTRRAIR